MPTRMIREGIIDSRSFHQLTDSAQLFYFKLLLLVDDYGRYEADIDLLRSKLFWRSLDRWPLSRVSEVLADVSTVRTDDGHELVTLYRVNGKSYLQVNNFNQRLRAKHSRCPSPDGQETVTCPSPDSHMPAESEENRKRIGRESEESNPLPPNRPDAPHRPDADAKPLPPVSNPNGDLCAWYEKTFTGEWLADTWQQFPRYVDASNADAFKANVPLWMRTRKWRDGFGVNSVKFLQQRTWLKPPPKSMLADEPEPEPEMVNIDPAEAARRSVIEYEQFIRDRDRQQKAAS